jgi:hypothetical protein
MSDRYELFDNQQLADLLEASRNRLADLESQLAIHGTAHAASHIKADHREALSQVERIQAVLAQRTIQNRPSLPSLPSLPLPPRPQPLPAASVSPFVLGRPLLASERLFGHDQHLEPIVSQLANCGSANVIGRRRIGKTSLLNHLCAYCQQQTSAASTSSSPQQPAIVPVVIDLLGPIATAEQFYGTALLRLFEQMPASNRARLLAYDAAIPAFVENLRRQPSANTDEFHRGIALLRSEIGRVIPVVVVDEFERLLDPTYSAGFPMPQFYNGLRSLMHERLLAMLIASRSSLADYFTDPRFPGRLTSTFPTYFVPFELQPLDNEAAEAVLLQLGPQLGLAELEQARGWADNHPCLLQAAGQALHEMHTQRQNIAWAERRFRQFRSQNCMGC